MGKIAHTLKERTCLVCGQSLLTSSEGLKKHAETCAEIKRQPKRS